MKHSLSLRPSHEHWNHSISIYHDTTAKKLPRVAAAGPSWQIWGQCNLPIHWPRSVRKMRPSGIRSLSTYLSSNHKKNRSFPPDSHWGSPNIPTFRFWSDWDLVGVDKSHIIHLVTLNWCGYIIWDDNINCHIWDAVMKGQLSPNHRDKGGRVANSFMSSSVYVVNPNLERSAANPHGTKLKDKQKKRVTA